MPNGKNTGKLFQFPSGNGEGKAATLFEKKKEEEKPSAIIESLIKTEQKTVEKKRPILGEAPKIAEAMFIDQEYRLKSRLRHIHVLFGLLVVLFFVSYGFFTATLNPSFDLLNPYLGPNIAQKLQTFNEQLKKLQTDVNMIRYQTAKEHLDQFAVDADMYFQKFQEFEAAKASEKPKIEAELTTIRNRLADSFKAVTNKLTQPNYVALFREEEIPVEEAAGEFDGYSRDAFRQLKADLKQKGESEDKIRMVDETTKLIANVKLKALFGADFDRMTVDKTADFIDRVFSSVSNPLALVYKVKKNRANWSPVVKEIDEVTKSVDMNYKSGLFEQFGGITYDAFDFDAVTRRITLSGKTKSFDAKNFSLVATLIDILERSPKFRDVDMRSFTKSGSLESGYSGTLKIDLSLQQGSDPRDVIGTLKLPTLPSGIPTAPPAATVETTTTPEVTPATGSVAPDVTAPAKTIIEEVTPPTT